MERKLIKNLIQWKNNPDRMPLIIRGARQVGKTWLMKEFGRTEFESVAYINFDRNERMMNLFSGDFSTDRLIKGLSVESGTLINPEKTLIILDEIQEVPAALHSLKYFCEDERYNYYIIAAGSLLGIALHEGTSFPVGKTESLTLYPLSFTEFLLATGNESLVSLLNENDTDMITAFKNRYIDLLKTYYYVGGMPAAVNAYVSSSDLNRVRSVQTMLLNDYMQDFSKHAPTNMIPRINLVWEGIPSQLAKENKKFVYSLLREGARAREFEPAIQWLTDCGLCTRINRVNKGGIPLKAYEDIHSFKLYMADVGLLGAMAELDARTLLKGSEIFVEFKGALTEQFICQEIMSQINTKPYYWSSEKGDGKLDFLIQKNGKIYPVEVKAEENLNAKSLKYFISKYDLPFGVRTSMSDYRKDEKIINIPLYMFSVMESLCEQPFSSPSEVF